MSVSGGKLPTEQQLLGAVDETARRTVADAQRKLAPIVSREVPRKSGTTAGALRPKLSRTATGYALTVGPPRKTRHPSGATIAQVVRWVNRGTGVLRQGPGDKAPIHSPHLGRGFNHRPMILPGGKRVMSVKGQPANRFMARVAALGDVRVGRIYAAGAKDAARSIERNF